jgi:surfeit locus 1 family protein
MSGAASRRWRTGWALPTLFALAAFATFVGLGTWQLQRKAWKEALIDTLEQRLAASPVNVPGRARWPSLDPAEDEFRRVKFSAAFLPGQEALVYGSGSALRSDVSGPGYWVFAPARLAGGDLVVVNRGFVPEGRQDQAARSAAQSIGTSEMVGVMRWPEPRGTFTVKEDTARNLWFVRDQMAIAAAKGWGEVAPFYVELESPQPPGGLPRAGALKIDLRNTHLQYAITWYGLAAVVAVMFGFWLRGRPRTGAPAPSL